MRNAIAILVLGASLSAAAESPLVTPEEKTAARQITPDVLRAHIRFLASDLLEGRGPATRGDRLAEAYIQSQMEALGLKPGAPGGGYVQKVPLVGIRASFPEGPAVFRSPGGMVQGIPGENLVASSGVQKSAARIENAEVVFVGYGIVAPEYQWDDYKDADLRGKVLLVMNNDPESDPNLFAGKTRLWYGRWDYKYLMAARKGAAGAIIIHTTPSAGYDWPVVQSSWQGELFELPEDSTPRVSVKAWATEELSRKIASLGGKDLDQLRAAAESRAFRPVPLGVTMSVALANTIGQKESGNVIGVLPGGDPKRAGEAVIYTAHHDHFGVRKGAKPGEVEIYHGALDNASGVASYLAVARAFAALKTPPARSVYFAFVAGEEQGLLGSEYLAKHLPLPAGRIAADINADGIGTFGRTRDVSMIGLGKSSIDDDVVALARMQDRVVTPDEFPDRGTFYRSDQLNFARIGVPAAYLKAGIDVIGKPSGWGREQAEAYVKNDYHKPSDELKESWDFAGAVEDSELAFHLGCRLANAPTMPRWKKGDEFEAARLKALAETAATR
jgi:Zn-dependent M28 family amino/carboxypeptidase